MEKKKYHAAVEAYNELIRVMKEEGVETADAASMLADLYYNRGVVYAGMFLYKQAASSFRKSYELKRDKDTIQSYFLAKRMELSEQEYVDLVAKHPESYEITLQVESKIEALEQQWKQTPECMGLEHMRQWRAMGENQKYYEESEQVVSALKEEYRSCV